ncbi:MAG: hypothetical protein WKF73_12285 [Nocardioidaceae bacterium]
MPGWLRHAELAAFDVVRHTPLGAEAAWARLTDWPSHSEFIPFTEVACDRQQVTEGVGTVFVARTSLGPLGIRRPHGSHLLATAYRSSTMAYVESSSSAGL